MLVLLLEYLKDQLKGNESDVMMFKIYATCVLAYSERFFLLLQKTRHDAVGLSHWTMLVRKQETLPPLDVKWLYNMTHYQKECVPVI